MIIWFCACILLVLTFSSCKKDSKEPEKEKLPVLGRCESVPPKGSLTHSSPEGPYIYRTSGGGTIEVDPALFIIFRHDDYPAFKIEMWGETNVNGQTKTAANHENLNGKHIKDRLGSRRSVIFPDGTKLTLFGEGPYGPLFTVSIYDGDQSHHINPTCNRLEHSSTSGNIAKLLDDAELDGETSAIEFTATGLLWVNLYSEDVIGNKVQNRYNLAEIFRDQPNAVRDYYDDTRLGHTRPAIRL